MTLDRNGTVCIFSVWKNKKETSIIQGIQGAQVHLENIFLSDLLIYIKPASSREIL